MSVFFRTGVDLTQIDDWIYDLDYTLYQFDPNYHEKWLGYFCKGACDIIDDLDEETARKIAFAAYQEGKCHYQAFMENYNKTFEALHTAIYPHVDLNNVKPYPDAIQNFETLKQANKRNSILTFGCTEPSKKTVNHLGFTPYFKDEHIVGCDLYEFEEKRDGSKGIKKMMTVLDADPKRSAFTEDSLANLKHPKNMGVVTIWLHHGRKLDDQDLSHVDIIAKDLPALQNELIKQLNLHVDLTSYRTTKKPKKINPPS